MKIHPRIFIINSLGNQGGGLHLTSFRGFERLNEL
jgi:hypothetical protein